MSAANSPVPPPGTYAFDDKPVEGTIFPVASRAHDVASGVYNSDECINHAWKGVRLFINAVTVGSGTVTVKIQVKDPVSGTYVDLPLAVTGAINANGITTLTVYPSLTETSNVDAATALGRSWRVVATVATGAVEFGVSGEYLA